MNEYEPPLMPYDPDLAPGFNWAYFALAALGGAALIGGAIYFWPRR
jgi:hypothetical protein